MQQAPSTELNLLDHLVSAGQQRWWHCEAEHLRGLEIDNQFESSWKLRRQIAWIGSLLYFIHKRRGASPALPNVGAIAYQTALISGLTPTVHGRQMRGSC